MLSKNLETALNNQVRDELYSSYLYLSISAYFESINFSGFAAWMKAQANEEYFHAMKIYDYIHVRGGRVTLHAIAAPPAEWKSVLDGFETAYEHEKKVTAMINNLVDISIQEKDHAANSFLQWFVTEQVEEESTALRIVEDLKMIGDNKGALFMYDREAGRRGQAAGTEA